MTEIRNELKRPGGPLANRPLHLFYLVDGSSSVEVYMGIINTAIQGCIPELKDAAKNNPNAQILIRALKFGDGAEWLTTEPVPIEDYSWTDLEADGLTSMGKAFELLAAQLDMPPMPERGLPPVIVLLSDGAPTDSYEGALEKLKGMAWFRKAVKIAISIGDYADDDLLAEFTGNKELVLKAKDTNTLVNLIKWASTTVSTTAAQAKQTMPMPPKPADEPVVFDMNQIKDPSKIGEGDVW